MFLLSHLSHNMKNKRMNYLYSTYSLKLATFEKPKLHSSQTKAQKVLCFRDSAPIDPKINNLQI